MGREEIPVVPPKLITHVIHFAPTNISLSYNVETTVRTTNVTSDTLSHERLERELRLVSVERGFQPMPRASLSTFASLLSSVNAIYGSPVALYYLQKLNDVKAKKISDFEEMRQFSRYLFNGLPGDRSRGSQRPTQREERVYIQSRRLLLSTRF